MALKGIRVVELAGLAPVPFCGMILSDFGASVIRVDRTSGGNNRDTLARGKRSIAVNLKKPEGVKLVRELCKETDVLVEPFRKGVMEKLGLGPSVLTKENPRLVYARLTGYGQEGPMSDRAGHDINYLAISGLLSRMGRAGDKPYAPLNIAADFAGGGLTCALGITMALLDRVRTGKGQVIDSNMVEGAAYVGSYVWSTQHLPTWGPKRGQGKLDGGTPWYDTYQTKDGKYMSVGAVEPKFYAQLIEGLCLSIDDYPQKENYPKMAQKFTEVFASKTRAEWCEVFEHADACVAPVVDLQEAAVHPHNRDRQSFVTSTAAGEAPLMPQPAPRLSSHPPAAATEHRPRPVKGQHTQEILTQLGYSAEHIAKLEREGVVDQAKETKL